MCNSATINSFQKTLFNVEGMGRRLYPDLDLWKTAKPNLENGSQKRLDTKNIFRI